MIEDKLEHCSKCNKKTPSTKETVENGQFSNKVVIVCLDCGHKFTYFVTK